MDDFNPYAAPEAPRSDILPPEDDEGRGVWSDGPTLVMSRYATLPSRCVKCDGPATTRLSRTLTWLPPIMYWLVPFFGIIYVIAYYGYRKTAKIEVPLCSRHRAWRRRVIFLAWIIAFAGFGLVAYSTGEDGSDPILGSLGTWIFFVGLAFGLLGSRMVRADRIERDYLWLRGAGPAYLQSLTPLPRPETEVEF